LKKPRKTAPKAVDPTKIPQPGLAAWLRRIADKAEQGELTAFAAVAWEQGFTPATYIVDPVVSEQRMTLAGTTQQLVHMLQTSEMNTRMASVAQQVDGI
jgi:hypothetical protein